MIELKEVKNKEIAIINQMRKLESKLKKLVLVRVAMMDLKTFKDGPEWIVAGYSYDTVVNYFRKRILSKEKTDGKLKETILEPMNKSPIEEFGRIYGFRNENGCCSWTLIKIGEESEYVVEALIKLQMVKRIIKK